MDTRTLRVGVIGAGRVGAVLAAALRAAGYQVAAVAGESAASRTRIETLLPGVPVLKPTAVARACDLLLLTVPDDALDNVVRMLVASGAIRSGQLVIHTSGRHGVDVLQPVVEIGAHAVAMHPAMTFTGTDIDLERLAGCVFGITCGPAERPAVEQLAGDLSALSMWLDEADRGRYHVALAHGANHLVTLVGQAMQLLRSSGAQDPSAVLRPLLTAALDNVLSYGEAALTGPVVRGDLETIASHLATLSTAPRDVVESYVVLARATANSAVADGRLEPRRAAAMVEILNDALTGNPL
ncbi:MAG: Rossmann-like and DUF2520 domain-containing protein [Nocardioidaceae bacterium]